MDRVTRLFTEIQNRLVYIGSCPEIPPETRERILPVVHRVNEANQEWITFCAQETIIDVIAIKGNAHGKNG